MASIDEMALSELDRSNKGASKQRRDQINAEIAVMRDLLPLPESSRQRLSQLQIMSLTCVYIRKCNVLQKLFRCKSRDSELPDFLDFFQAMTGFLLVTTRDGKLLYISENVTDYLGHSMVDMKTQGDSLYDIVDKRDHGTVRTQLLQGRSQQQQESSGDVSFFCRMNMSRTLKRQPGFGDVKVMYVRGHFKNMNSTEPGCPSDNQCVFMATCSPLITPDIKENLVQNNTMVFKTVHKLDMSFLGLSKNGEFHLGCTTDDLIQRSWYSLLYPEDILEAKEKHTQLIRSNHETSCMLTIRMLKMDGSSFWVNIVMHMQPACLSQNNEPLIVCINQVIDAQEAFQIKVQGHMFSMYPNCAHDLWGSHLTSICSPVQNNTGSQWISQHASNALHVSEHPVNIPSYIEHVGSPDVFLNTYPSISSSSNNQVADCALQSSFVQQDQLKAMLKRKIQGPQSKSCTPYKLPRMNWGTDNFSGFSGCPDMGQGISQDEQYSMTSVPSNVDCQNQIMQVQQPYGHTSGLMTANKMSMKQVTCKGVSKVNHMISEQIVPESFLTPDPSPISSPQPSNLTVKTEVLDPEEKGTQGKSEVILQALGRLAALQHMNSDKKVQVNEKERELPILDVFSIQNFFDKLTGEVELKTSFRMEDQMNSEMKSELPDKQVSDVNIPNFEALKVERSSPSLCIPSNSARDVLSNTHPSAQMQPQMKLPSQSHVQSTIAHSLHSQPQVRPFQQHAQLPKSPSSHPQIQSQMKISSESQPKNKPLSHILPQIKPSFQPQMKPPSQTQSHKQPSSKPSINISNQSQVKYPVPHSFIQAFQNAPIKSLFDCHNVDANALELHSNACGYHKDTLMSSTVASSPESVTSQETIDELMSYLSDDGLDQMKPHAKNPMTEEVQDIHSEKSFYMEISDRTKLPQIDTQHTSELHSPESSISSLEDDLFDNSDFDLEMALNDIITSDQILLTSNNGIKYLDDLGMSNDFRQDLMLNSWVPPQGSLDFHMIKHSQ